MLRQMVREDMAQKLDEGKSFGPHGYNRSTPIRPTIWT